MPPTPEHRVPVVYGSAVLTGGGRVADRTILTALDWRPGTAIDIRPALPGVATPTTVAEAAHAVTANGRDASGVRDEPTPTASGCSTSRS